MATAKQNSPKPAAKAAETPPKTDEVAVQVTPNKFFSAVAPKQSDREGARKFAVNDEWHDVDGVVQKWNGTAWEKAKSNG